MLKALKSVPKKAQSGGALIGIVVTVIFAIVLIPVLADLIGSAQNLTTTESTLLSFVTLFIVLGVIVLVARKTGLMKSS